MAQTPAEVCNIALGRVGSRQQIDEFDTDTSAEAQLCRAFYETARDELLTSHPWSWATKRETLAELETDPPEDWEYAYALPSDCLEPQYIWSGSRNPAAEDRVAFSIEYDEETGVGVLYTDKEEAELVYTRRTAEVGLFSAKFVSALAWRLAQDLALSLPVKPQLALSLDAKAEQALGKAMAADKARQQMDPPVDSEFIRERG